MLHLIFHKALFNDSLSIAAVCSTFHVSYSLYNFFSIPSWVHDIFSFLVLGRASSHLEGESSMALLSSALFRNFLGLICSVYSTGYLAPSLSLGPSFLIFRNLRVLMTTSRWLLGIEERQLDSYLNGRKEMQRKEGRNKNTNYELIPYSL